MANKVALGKTGTGRNRRNERMIVAVGGSFAPGDRGTSGEGIRTLLSRGGLSRDELDLVIVGLKAIFGNRIRRSLRAQLRSIPGGPGAFDEDDILQEMWLKVAWQVVNGGARDVENLGGWLYRIAQGCLVDHVRRRKAEIEAIKGRFVEFGDHRLPGPSDAIAERESSATLAEAVKRLDEPSRTIILRRFFHGHKLSVIATQLGLPGRRVRSLYYRGLARLRAELAKQHRPE